MIVDEVATAATLDRATGGVTVVWLCECGVIVCDGDDVTTGV